jgi:glutathione S-transferase
MQLFYSNTSPYSRKVRLVIQEKGLHEHVKQILCNPFDDVPALKAANPLAKVPTLITDTGMALYDSPVICEYLDDLTSEKRLIPASGMIRWQVRRWEALADGILDAAYSIVMERRRPSQEQSAQWMTQWETEITRAVQQAERDLHELPDYVSLAQLALAAALGYLDFRLPGLDWRRANTNITAWYAAFKTRSSMQQTSPE